MGKLAKFEFSDSLYLSAMQFRSWDLRIPPIAFEWLNSIKSISTDRCSKDHTYGTYFKMQILTFFHEHI